MYRFRQLIVLAGISASLACPVMAMDEELFPKPLPVPPEIVARIEGLLQSLTPEVQGTVNEHRWHDYSWRCMDYLIHNEGKNYQLATKGAYSRSKHKYWQHFHMSYEGERVNPAPFRLDILYGKRTDKKLLQAIADAFDKRYKPVTRF